MSMSSILTVYKFIFVEVEITPDWGIEFWRVADVCLECTQSDDLKHAMCCMICMLLCSTGHISWQIPLSILQFICFLWISYCLWWNAIMGWSYTTWCVAVCVSDSVLHNHLQALALIHFGFAIQPASRWEYVWGCCDPGCCTWEWYAQHCAKCTVNDTTCTLERWHC